MALPFGTIQVNQTTPVTPASSSPATTTVLALFGPFPIGPTGWTLCDPAQALLQYTSASSNLGYSGVPALIEATSQAAGNGVYALKLLMGRTHVTSASGYLTDGSAHNLVSLTGVGAYSGSKGNNLSIATTAPLIAINRTQYGNGAQNEIQQLIFYATSGETGTFTLTGVDSGGTSRTTASITFSTTAATLAGNIQTALNAVSGSGGLGASAVTVAAAGGTPAIPGSIVINVTFTGTNYTKKPQTLLTATPTLSGGSGTVPVQSITISDTAAGTTLQTITLSSAVDLSSASGIATAINNANTGATAVVAATLVSSTYMVTAQTVALSGGADGAGGTVANDSNSTITALLNDLASGNYGQVDFICGAFDAATVVGQIQAAIATARGNNCFPKAVLGPMPGTALTTLKGTYQNANSSYVTFLAPDQLQSASANVGTLPGYALAAGAAALKGTISAEYNLWGQPLGGVAKQPIKDLATGATYTPTDYADLEALGIATLRYDAVRGGVVLGNLCTTAAKTNPDGSLNPFQYLSVQDCWDRIAAQVVVQLKSLIGFPSTSQTDMQTMGLTAISTVLASTKGRYHNGATATVVYNAQTNLLTFNVTEGPRLPLAAIVVNLAALVGFSN